MEWTAGDEMNEILIHMGPHGPKTFVYHAFGKVERHWDHDSGSFGHPFFRLRARLLRLVEQEGTFTSSRTRKDMDLW